MKPVNPEQTEEQAALFTRDRLLSRAGATLAPDDLPWSPAWGASPDWVMTVGVTGSDHKTVQSAVDAAIMAAVADGQGGLAELRLAEGQFDGLVYLPNVQIGDDALRFRITGTGQGRTVLTAAIDAEMPGPEYRARFGAQFAGSPLPVQVLYEQIADLDKLSTANASVLRNEAVGTCLQGLSIRNTYNCDRDAAAEGDAKNAQGQYLSGQHQAVALLSLGDGLAVRDVALHSFQDTLYLQSREGRITRSAFEDCLIEGDVDFIFGQGTAHFQGCTIRSLGSRKAQSWATAPSTRMHVPYGFVFNECHFTHDGAGDVAGGQILLGRQWFEAVRATPYGTPPDPDYRVNLGPVSILSEDGNTISRQTLESVGKCVLLNCRISSEYNPVSPWGPWCGGHWDRDGQHHPAPWHPRYRPVQTGLQDLQAELGPWLAAQGICYDPERQELIWLGMWRCQFDI